MPRIRNGALTMNISGITVCTIVVLVPNEKGK